MKDLTSDHSVAVTDAKIQPGTDATDPFSKSRSLTGKMCEKIYWLVLFLIFLSTALTAQSYYSEGNPLVIHISTATGDYAFSSSCMSARLDSDKGCFEFTVLFSTITSKGTASDLEFLRKIMQGSNSIVLEASIPYNDDGVSDVSYLAAFPSIQLLAELHIGKLHMITDLLLCEIKVVDQFIRFDFDCFMNTRSMPMAKLVGEKIREIRLEAEGIALTKAASF